MLNLGQRALLLLLVMLVLAPGCKRCGGDDDDDKQPLGGACQTTADCREGECLRGTCRVCSPGQDGCACRENNSCDTGLECHQGTCQPCTPGTTQCVCLGDGGCNDGLTCTNRVCVSTSCVAGTLSCPCRSPGNTCDHGLTCNTANLCVTCSNSVVGCPCVSGACGNNLVCDALTTTCRVPITCTPFPCKPHQVCSVQSPGQDATCAEDCEDGWTWNPNTNACDEEVKPNCGQSTPGSILAECQGRNRECVATDESARCGDCLPYFADGLPDGGTLATCRALVSCATIESTCAAQHRACSERTTTEDAVCGECVTIYHEVNGICVEAPEGTCSLDAGTSLGTACQERNRQCIEPTPGRAYCGSCLSGFTASQPDPEPCVSTTSCESLGCAALNRLCPVPPQVDCGECLPGLVPSNPSDKRSVCRKPVTCAELACPHFCEANANGDAVCIAPSCPQPNQARRPDNNQCITCQGLCNRTGETGRWWPIATADAHCVCETAEGYYHEAGISVGAEPCDGDRDGWVRDSARGAINSLDSVLASNARCSLRYVDRVALVNEYLETLEIHLCQDGQHLAGQPCANALVVPLYESVRNDDQVQLNSAFLSEVPVWSNGVNGRRPRAAELNAFTKGCVSPTGDYNHNSVADVDEWQGSPLDTSVFGQFSYFLELHTGFYEPPSPGQTHGRYVIKERSRCEASFPVGYAAEEGNYWRECMRKRDSAYNEGRGYQQNLDFAQWSCESAINTCPTPPPPADPPLGSQVPSHGLCEVQGDLPWNDGVWRGMGHHSQFKCVVISQSPIPSERSLTRRTLAQLHNGPADPGPDQFNECHVACPTPPDPTCAVDCVSGDGGCTSSERPSGTLANPWHPVVACTPLLRSGVSVDDVGWVAVRQASGAYRNGCINEFEEPLFQELCPGYLANPAGIAGESDVADFGRIVCGCNQFLGGPMCEIGCPVTDVFVSAVGYSASKRQGYWACMRPVATQETVLSSQPVDGGVARYSVTGRIPGRVKVMQPLQAAEDGGYVIH